MKHFITILLTVAFLHASTPYYQSARAQAAPVMFVLGCASVAAGLLVWVWDKNTTTVTMRWVVFERGMVGGPWTPCATNYVLVGPKKFEAFPAFYVYSTNNACWYKARLAEQCEIPQNQIVQLNPNSDVQPIIQDPNKVAAFIRSNP